MYVKHGDTKARLYALWREMRKRCNPSNNIHAIRRYAARGIYVCAEWQRDYLAFKAWALSNGYVDGLSIDRIDNDGPYSPENCRWVTHKEQCRNRRTTRLITVEGVTRSRAEWLEQTGVSSSAFQAREERGWDTKRALGIQS